MTRRSDPSQTKRRLTSAELKKLGLSSGSRRYVSRNVKNVTKTTKTISYRQYQNQLNEYRYKEKLSREQLTKQRASGEKSYKSYASQQTAEKLSRLAKIRKKVPGITREDARLIDKKNTLGWDGLTEEDRQNFRQLFKKYEPKDETAKIRAALGSPDTMRKFKGKPLPVAA